METLNPTTSTTVDDGAVNIGFSILMRFSDSRREIDLEIRKLITVMCQVFRDHKAPPMPLAYLGATCSSLDLIAASKPRPSDDVLHAHIIILSIVIPKVPPAFLINNLQLVCNSLAPALRSSSPSFDGAACTGVKCIAQLLIRSTNCVNNWSQVSKPFRLLFRFAYVSSIEVREQAGSCVHDTLQSFRGTPLFGPASKTITDLLMKKYPPPRVESNTDGVNSIEQRKAMHTLNLVMLSLGAMSTEDRTAVLVYFMDLLELHHTYVTRLITDALYRFCLNPSSPDVDLELLLDLICSICLSVSQHKTNYIMNTIAGLLNFGVPKVYSLNKQICKIKLPIMFDALIVLLEQSDLMNVQDAANAFMRLIAYIDESMIKQGVDRALMNANMDDGSQSEPTPIEKLCATFPKLLSYRCPTIRYLVFEIVSTMFNKLGVHSSYLMRGTVKTLADMQILPDREFPFKEEVKILLEMVSEKCGLDAISAIIPQEHMELLAEINQQLGSKSVDASSHVSKATTSGNNLSHIVAEERTYIIHPMALPDREITQLALDVEQSPSTVAARTASLRTGGNQSSATRTMSTRHESSAEDLNLDYYLPLYHAAFRGNWEDARRFLEHDPNAVKAKISNLSMTALHVAACEGHSEFVEKIVKHMPADELAEHDEMGFTALHYAAIGGNLRSAKALLKENPKLAQSVDTKGRTPLHLAASFSSECKELVWYLLLVTTDEEPGHPFTGPWASNLMNVLIASGFHDIALYLLQQYPNLATATDQENRTPLYVLAKNQSNFLSGSRLGFWESCIYPFIPIDVDYRPPNSMRAYVGSHHESVQNLNRMPSPVQNGALYWLRRLLCGALKQIAPSGFMTLQDTKLRHHCAVELVKQICIELSRSHMSWHLNYLWNSEILYIATLNGITEIISTLIEFFPDLIWARLSNNQYLLLPFAIELRHEKVFRLVCDHTARSKLMASTLLESGTILHLAAKLAPLAQLTSVYGPALQMQRELQWFKVVENLVHPYYKQRKNGDEKTAKELFTKEHENLAERGEKWLKGTSNSCMVVSTLIAAVVFAAAFTVPGGIDGADGNPNFLMKKPFIFMVFLVSDAVALFSSLTSVLMFLSILTARYAEEDFIDSLPKRLIIGLASLFFAIAATMVAFGAIISIVLSKRFSWVSIPITILASFPVTLFALLQLPLFIQMVRSTFGNTIFRP